MQQELQHGLEGAEGGGQAAEGPPEEATQQGRELQAALVADLPGSAARWPGDTRQCCPRSTWCKVWQACGVKARHLPCWSIRCPVPYLVVCTMACRWSSTPDSTSVKRLRA